MTATLPNLAWHRWLGLACLAWPVAAFAQATPWTRLDERAIRQQFADRELGDGTHYAHRFHRDGVFEGTEMGRLVQGKWHAAAGQLCTARLKPRRVEECFVVQRSGPEVRLLSNDYVVYQGRLAAMRSSAPSDGGGPGSR